MFMKVLTWLICTLCTSCFHMPRRKIVYKMTKSIVPLGLITLPESSNAVSIPWTLSDLYTNLENNSVKTAAFSEDGNHVNVLDIEGQEHLVRIFPSQISEIEKIFRRKNVSFVIQANPYVSIFNTFLLLVNVVIPVGILSLILNTFRGNGQMPSGGGSGGPFGILQNAAN